MVVRATKRKAPRRGYAERKGLFPEHAPYVPEGVPTHVEAASEAGPGGVFDVATYNVHRWSGVRGGARWQPGPALSVIAELGADVLALQEVLRPTEGPDPLECLARDLRLHYAFAPTRRHRQGVLGNAILARWPITSFATIDLSVGRLEPRSAIAAQFDGGSYPVAVIATHLAIVDRVRRWQVRTLLEHPDLQGSVVLLGDMNAWRRCRATRTLDDAFTELHDNHAWPASFPAARPVLALDRIYARGAQVDGVDAYATATAVQGSDHLPVRATITLDGD